MKLSKMGLLATFVPALALADPPVQAPDDTTNTDKYDQKDDQTGAMKSDKSDASPFGLTVKSLSADKREALGGPKDAGLLVTRVDSGSPAEKAGVKVGDVITKVDDKALADSSDLDNAWKQDKQQAKEQASIEVVRDHETKNLEATLEQSTQDKLQQTPQQTPQGDMNAPKGG